MSLGSVSVNNLDLAQGTPSEVECLDLFVGAAPATQTNHVHAVNMSTDLDVLLGAGASNVKTQVEAARTNGGQNWFAYVLPLAAEANLLDEVDKAVGKVSVESVVNCELVTTKADLENMQAKANEIIAKYQRRLFFQCAFRGPTAEETWSVYSAQAKSVTENVDADRVVIVPSLYEDFLGALAGRFANKAVSVADSPMRVATGTLLGNYTNRPVDANDVELDKSVLQDLHNNGRFTVPTWYEDYAGTFTSDGYTLAAETSDYRVIENLRVADKAARRIYLLAVARVGNRQLNSTPQSIAYNSTYFMKPLREMSHSVEINGIPFPAEIEPPKAGDINITWPTKFSVEIYFSLRLLNSPKDITANISLDLNNYAEGS